MPDAMQPILDAILAASEDPSSTTVEDFAALAVPESYRAVTVRKDEVDMFEGMESREKDPRKSLHLDEVPLPDLGPAYDARIFGVLAHDGRALCLFRSGRDAEAADAWERAAACAPDDPSFAVKRRAALARAGS